MKKLITSAGVRTDPGLPAYSLSSPPPGISIVTSLPGSPVDLQQCIYTDSLASPTFRWRFMYNASSASSYKWEFQGGTSVQSSVLTAESRSSSTYGDLATDGPTYTLPLNGDWVYQWRCRAGNTTGTDDNFMVVVLGTNTFSLDGLQPVNRTSNGAYFNDITGAGKATSLSATNVLRARYKSGGGSGVTFSDRFLVVTPIRVS
jgi:hypothetical protein